MNETTRILIIEDLPTDAELAAREIRKSLGQCTFQRVETSEGFLEALETFNPDVILSDYHMPQFDGMTALKLAQVHAPLTPVIVWTGSLSEDIAVECMKAGASNYVIKENIKRLGSAVIHALEERKGWLEKKEAENRLRDSEARYRTTLNNMMEGCQIIDFDWRYIYINETAASQGRQPAGDLLMRTMMEVYPGIEKTKLFEVLQHCMTERVFDRMDNEFIFPDGSLGWFELSIQPVPEGLFILSIDITERKQSEAALLESFSRFRALFEASPEAIMIIDPQGNWPILDCNTAACLMNGYSREELIGQSIDILNLKPGDEAERKDYLEEIQRSGVLRMEDFHRRKDGSTFPIELSTSMITVNGRQVVLGIDRDITERKRAEEELRLRAQTMTVLHETSRDLVMERDLSTLLNTIVQRAAQLLNAAGGGLYLSEPDLGQVRCVVSYAAPGDFTGTTLKYGEGAAGLVAQTGEPLIIDDYSKWSGQAEVFKDENPFRAVLSVPMKWLSEVIGVIDVLDFTTAREFTEDDVNLLTSFANQATIAVKNTQFNLNLERNNHVLTALQEATLPLIKQLELSDVLQAIIEQVGKLLNTTHSYIYLVKPEDEIVLTMGMGEFSRHMGQVLKANEGLAGKVWQTAQPLIVSDYHTWTGRSSLYEQSEVRTVVGVPLISGSKVTGVLGLAYLEPDRNFNADDLGMLNRFAQLASIALENARLYSLSQQELAERRQAEEALRESEALYRLAIETAGAVPYREYYPTEGDEHVKYEFIGEGIRQITGYGPEEFNSRLWEKLTLEMHPLEDLAEYSVDEAVQRVRSGKNPLWKCDFKIRARDGTIHWVFEAAVELRDEDGISHGSIGIYQDITERKQAEQAVKNSERRLRALIENGQDSISLLSRDGVLLWESPAIVRILGYAADEFIGQDLFALVHPDDLERIQTEYIDLLKEPERRLKGIFRLRHQDGRWIWVEAVASNLLDDPSVEAIVINYRDITERRQSEEELQKNAALLSEAQRIGRIGHWEWTGYDRDMICSDELLDLLQLPPNEHIISQQTLVAMIHPDDREHMKIAQRKAFSDQTDLDFEYRIIPGDNAEHWVHQYTKITYSQDGAPVRMLGILQDITGQKQADIEIRRRTDDLTLINDLNHALNRGDSLDAMMAILTKEARRVFACQDTTVYLLSPDRKHLVMQRLTLSGSLVQKIERLIKRPIPPIQIPIKAGSYYEKILQTKQGLIMSGPEEIQKLIADFVDTTFLPRLARSAILKLIPQIYKLLDIKSTVIVPLVSEGNVIGMLDLSSKNIFLEEDLVRLQSISGQLTAAILHVQAKDRMQENEKRYRSLFEDSPISLWEEDFSLVKQRLDALRQEGVKDFRVYFTAHPDEVRNCASMVRISDVNKATLSLYGAQNKEDLTISLSNLLEGESIQQFEYELVNIAEGATHFEWEGINRTLDDRMLYINLKWSVIPGYEEDLSKVIVSIIDVTERKRAEIALQEREARYRGLFEDSPVALREEDFSAVKQRLDDLRQAGVTDFRAYLALHPEIVTECATLAKVVDVNKAAVELYQVGGKINMQNSLTDILGDMAIEHFKDQLADIADGQTRFGWEGLDNTTDGRQINVEVGWAVAPGYERDLSKVIVSIVDVTERKQAEERLQKQLMRITALRDIDRVITSSLDLHLTMSRIVSQINNQLEVKAAAILIFDPNTYMLEYIATQGFTERKYIRSSFRLGEGLAGTVAMTRNQIHYTDLKARAANIPEVNLLLKEGFVEYFGLPLVSKGQLRGVMEVFNKSPLDPIPEWVEYLETLAGQAAIAIDNIQLFDGLQRKNLELSLAYDATIEGWSHALDLRDKETEGHTQRVMELSLELARAFGLKEQELRNVRWGALLHDIGKMGVPDSILLKPGPLTEDEWRLMKQHPVYASEMLQPIHYLREALDIPRYHHEKWDGGGYPYGLKGEQIPLAARIFAIVDIWDAVRSDRPYRSAWSATKALDYIREISGTHLDPQVVKIFLETKIYDKN